MYSSYVKRVNKLMMLSGLTAAFGSMMIVLLFWGQEAVLWNIIRWITFVFGAISIVGFVKQTLNFYKEFKDELRRDFMLMEDNYP